MSVADARRTARAVHHVGDLPRRRLVRCEDEVALVLPVLVIEHEHELASSDCGNRIFNAREVVVCGWGRGSGVVCAVLRLCCRGVSAGLLDGDGARPGAQV